MNFTSAWQVGLLLLFGLSLVPDSGAITDKERDTILDGIEAGKSFTGVLQQKDFGKVLKSFGETISPWIEGIGMFGKLIGMFLPEENEMLEEMKKGFKEVNKRLDAIKEELTIVKEAIDWAVVKVKFVEIETNIKILDDKLKDVHLAPNPDHGKAEYIRVYESQYDEAGLKLFDSIAHNDQIFSENVLTAGMKYTDYYRDINQDYMRGLIALMMKSSNIEVSYEKFMKQDKGMETIWKLRLQECQEAMANADLVLEDAWEDLMASEANNLAKSCQGCSHVQFRDLAMDHFNTKYYWRYWFIISYDDGGNRSIRYYPFLGHRMSQYYGHNFVLMSSDSSRHFDLETAKSYIIDRECTAPINTCRMEAEKELLNSAPFYGVLVATFSDRISWAAAGPSTRMAYSKAVYLWKGSWSAKLSMFYFG